MMDDAERARHFTRRLESFSDIVFGFSLSLLGGRLIVPQHANAVFADAAALSAFFVTFGALVGCWFLNYRMFRDFYEPMPLTTAMVFVELAGVALLPYALATVSKFRFSQPQPLVLYDLVFLAVTGSNAVVAIRGFRIRWATWNDKLRREMWRRVLIQRMLTVLFAGAIPFAFAFPAIGWLPYWTIPLLTALMRRFYRGLPAFARDAPGALALPSR
jgi:uncharacterized membrane protein